MTDLTDKSTRYLKIINIAAFAAMVMANVLAEVLPINGVTTAERSDMYPSLFTPTGFTFSIWIVIYLAVGYFIVWQAIGNRTEVLDKLGLSFALSCALNIGWILAWHYDLILLSTVLILGLLANVYLVRYSLNDEHWIVKSAFSVYEAWLTIASMASIFILLDQILKGFPFGIAAQILVWVAALAAVVLAFLRLRTQNDYAYAATMAWSIFGITIKHISSNGFAVEYMHIVIGTIICIIAIVAMILVSILGNKRKFEVVKV